MKTGILALQLCCRDEVLACFTRRGDTEEFRWVDSWGNESFSETQQDELTQIASEGGATLLTWFDMRTLEDVRVIVIFSP